MGDKQLEILLRLADDGDAWAKEQLSAIVSGVVDDTYKVLQRDNRKEYYVRQLRARADNGDAEAMGEIGDCCYGVNQDYDEAAKWYRLAAEQGDANAQYILGVLYEDGLGVEQSDTEAEKWYRKAAEQGNTDAAKRLAKLDNEV